MRTSLARSTEAADVAASPPVILHCLDGLGIGGAERQLILLLRHIPPQMFRHVVCHVGPRRELTGDVRALGIPVFDLSGGKRYSLRALVRLIRLARQIRPALIHADHDNGKLHARLACWVLRIPLLTTMGLTVRPPVRAAGRRRSLGRRLLSRAQRTIADLVADRMLAISDTVRDSLIRSGVSPARITVIHRSLDPDEFRPLPPSQLEGLRRSLGLADAGPLLVNVARLIGRKGQETIIRALPTVRRRYPETKLLLVGDGPAGDRYRALVQAEGVADAVVFLGTRHDVPRLLQLGDVFVFPSQWEGMGVALLEAMAMSRPCVVSDLDVFREVLGPDGVFVPVGRPDLLAAAVEDLLADPDRAAAMGRRARERIEQRFNIRHNALEFTRLCQGLIAVSPRGQSVGQPA